MNAKPIRRLLAAVALALCAPASWSQASLTRADGRITDAGKSLSGVQVILSNPDTHQAYGTTTDEYGTFSFPEVARGTYIVSIQNLAGDRLFRKTLQLTSAPHAPIRLDIDISGAPAAPPASPPPAAQGSNSPAANGPVGCTASLILPMGTYSQGWPMGPDSPGGWAAVPYSAVEEFSVARVLNDGTIASWKRQSTAKVYQDSHGRRRRERPICSQLYEDAEAVLVSIDDPVAGYEYDLDPQNRIAYRYSLKALKDSVPAADGNRPGPHMEVTKEPLGSQSMEGFLAVGTRETRRLIREGARDNDRPITIVEEVWYSSEIRAVVLDKFIYEGFERRLTKIDRAEPDISLFQPPADYKIEDATGTVTINYTNIEVLRAFYGDTQARPEATGKPQNKTAPAPKPVEVRENPKDGLKYVWIPPGTFTMGCSPGDNECFDSEKPAHFVTISEGFWSEKPAHSVTISKGFWIGQTLVTVGAYKRFTAGAGQQMPPAPNFNSGWTNENMPIVNVNWNDAQAYCQWSGGRLPTEAEWEYAARGGSTEARYGPIDEIAWYINNSGGQTHEVAQKRANAFGLFDTLGNVLEWVNDPYDANYYQNSPSQDPPGPSGGQARVVRGGAWGDFPRHVRVSVRGSLDEPAMRLNFIGVRCVGEATIP